MKKDVINYIWTDKKRTIFGLPISFTRYFLTEDKFITRKDVDTPVKEVKSIKAPRDVLAQLDKYIDINRDRYRVRGRDMVGGDGGHCHDHDDFDIDDDII